MTVCQHITWFIQEEWTWSGEYCTRSNCKVTGNGRLYKPGFIRQNSSVSRLYCVKEWVLIGVYCRGKVDKWQVKWYWDIICIMFLLFWMWISKMSGIFGPCSVKNFNPPSWCQRKSSTPLSSAIKSATPLSHEYHTLFGASLKRRIANIFDEVPCSESQKNFS